MNTSIAKAMTDLINALKEGVESEPNSTGKQSTAGESRISPPTSPVGADKVEKLTNTLLNLLNPKK
jgi:hypothetical protein